MSTEAASSEHSFEVVVDHDGNLTVPADELARHGVGPGEHLRVVPAPRAQPGRRRARGMLADVIDSATLDQIEVALEQSRIERAQDVEGRWA